MQMNDLEKYAIIIVLGVQLSSRRFIKDVVKIIVRIRMKLLTSYVNMSY